MYLYEKVQSEYDRLSSLMAAVERNLEEMPEGSLVCDKDGKRYKHYIRKDKKKKYLRKDQMDLVLTLAKKKYLKKMLINLKRQTTAAGRYLRAWPKKDRVLELLEKQPHIEELLRPFLQPLDEKLRKWAEEDYPSTAGYPERLIHPGPNGKMYRSKSEATIAYALFRNRIPFRYEMDKDINGIIYHIDFTIRHPETGEMFYWEHFGKIDDIKYTANLGRKLTDFENARMFPGKNLILTFESAQFPLSIGEVEDIIHNWFL